MHMENTTRLTIKKINKLVLLHALELMKFASLHGVIHVMSGRTQLSAAPRHVSWVLWCFMVHVCLVELNDVINRWYFTSWTSEELSVRHVFIHRNNNKLIPPPLGSLEMSTCMTAFTWAIFPANHVLFQTKLSVWKPLKRADSDVLQCPVTLHEQKFEGG